mgnify:CR=1 FL=1
MNPLLGNVRDEKVTVRLKPWVVAATEGNPLAQRMHRLAYHFGALGYHTIIQTLPDESIAFFGILHREMGMPNRIEGVKTLMEAANDQGISMRAYKLLYPHFFPIENEQDDMDAVIGIPSEKADAWDQQFQDLSLRLPQLRRLLSSERVNPELETYETPSNAQRFKPVIPAQPQVQFSDQEENINEYMKYQQGLIQMELQQLGATLRALHDSDT